MVSSPLSTQFLTFSIKKKLNKKNKINKNKKKNINKKRRDFG
jgi:hypothetical protein